MTNEHCMKTSENKADIFAALAKAQAKIVSPAKNKTAKIGSYSYNYVDLAAILDVIKKPFAENGLSVVQIPIKDQQEVGVETMIAHSSGEWISGVLLLSVTDSRAQTTGSAITYARRYSLTAMLGMASEDDDDGAAAQQKRSIQQPMATSANPGSRSQAHAEARNAHPSSQAPQQTTQNRQVSPPVNPNATQSQPTTKAPFVGKCDACKSGINQATLDFSMKAYHAPYCFRCQQDIKKENQAQVRQEPGN